MAAIAAAFLMVLPVTGLAPLWATRHATPLMLAAIAALVLLVNAAWRDGRTAPPAFLRVAIAVASVELLPLVAIATYATGLRVLQHGWTPDRITAAALIGLACCYALGYAAAAFRLSRSVGIGTTNLASGVVGLALLIALLSPVADPARLAVADQLARLRSGRIAPDAFDFKFLRFDGATYGRQALEALRDNRDGPNATYLAAQAEQTLALQSRVASVAPATVAERRAKVTVYPAGDSLPDDFFAKDWNADERVRGQVPSCLRGFGGSCEAFPVDLDGDGAAEVVVLPTAGGGYGAAVFKRDGAGWRLLGTIQLTLVNCPGVRDAFRAGTATPVAPLMRDVEAAGVRLRLDPPGCRG
jgi:hypothetical protein